jgi:5-formyltetrahydrofolate cyclo-ligase
MIHAEKQRLRALLRETAATKAPGDPAPLITRLSRLEWWENSSSVLLYAPLPGEPDPMGILHQHPEKEFFFPRIKGTDLELFRWSAESRWISGPSNFPNLNEPDPESWERASAGKIDLALVPGLGFDTKGGRLGRGKGYYDRLLGDPLFGARKVALAWEWQIAEAVPTEAHDVLMDLIVTEERVICPAGDLDQADWTSPPKADRS